MSKTHEPAKFIPNQVKILAFVGMPGAGKSSAVDFLTSKGFPENS